MQHRDESAQHGHDDRSKEAYSTPKLVRHGNLREMTQGGGGTKQDGGSKTKVGTPA